MTWATTPVMGMVTLHVWRDTMTPLPTVPSVSPSRPWLSPQTTLYWCTPPPDLDPCNHTTPCLNGGTCSTTGPDEYVCECVDEFEGEKCQLNRTDECVPDPCQNGATCVVSEAQSYQSDC